MSQIWPQVHRSNRFTQIYNRGRVPASGGPVRVGSAAICENLWFQFFILRRIELRLVDIREAQFHPPPRIKPNGSA